jgi:hypothetical protein
MAALPTLIGDNHESHDHDRRSIDTRRFGRIRTTRPGDGRQGSGPNCGSNNTHGWSIMTPEERTAHCNKMMAFKTREECVAYQKEHHKQMEARAKEKGAQLPGAPRHGMCERMK